MAHHEQTLTGDADELARHVERAVSTGSATAKLESSSDLAIGDARMLSRTWERYSATGGNRVSLHLGVLAVGDRLAVSVTSAGGSQAVFLKLNTFGEEAFLRLAVDAIGTFGGGVPDSSALL